MLIITLAAMVLCLALCLALPDSWMESAEARFIGLCVRFETEDQRAHRLLLTVNALERTRSSSVAQLPKYKDYTTQLELILGLHRRFGAPLKEGLRRWKDSLVLERKKSRILQRHLNQGLAQAALMAVVIWSFMLVGQVMYSFNHSLLVLFVCLIAPLFGLGVYRFVIRRIERALFYELRLLKFSLDRLALLKTTGLCVSQIIELLGTENFPSRLSRSKKRYFVQFISLIELWRKTGTPLVEEVESMQEELRFLFEEAQAKLIQREGAVKLFVLMLFYLAPYLVYILGMLSSLLVLS
jgi:hypothetical protein